MNAKCSLSVIVCPQHHPWVRMRNIVVLGEPLPRPFCHPRMAEPTYMIPFNDDRLGPIVSCAVDLTDTDAVLSSLTVDADPTKWVVVGATPCGSHARGDGGAAAWIQPSHCLAFWPLRSLLTTGGGGAPTFPSDFVCKRWSYYGVVGQWHGYNAEHHEIVQRIIEHISKLERPVPVLIQLHPVNAIVGVDRRLQPKALRPCRSMH